MFANGLSFKFLGKDHFSVSSGNGFETSIVKMNKPFLIELLKPYVETKGLLKKDLLDIFKNINHTLELEEETKNYEKEQEELPLEYKKLELATKNYEKKQEKENLTEQQLHFNKLEEATKKYEKKQNDDKINEAFEFLKKKGEKAKSKTINGLKKINHDGIDYELDKSTDKIYKDGEYVADLVMHKGVKVVDYFKKLGKETKYKSINNGLRKIIHNGIEYTWKKTTNKIYKDGEYVADLVKKNGEEKIQFLKSDEKKRN